MLLKKGKKTIAEKIVLDAMEIIRSETSKAAVVEEAEDATRSKQLAEAAALQARLKVKQGGSKTSAATINTTS
jgi:ribosomal protein S7